MKFTNKEFIEKAIKIHGDKYDYSLVQYKNQKIKVKIICKEHGVFEQRPCNHIGLKQGCPSCVGLKKLNTEEFIKRANQVHCNKYDYSLSVCKNSYTKLIIICPVHGKFEQKPDNHINQKQGCPECGKLFKKFTTEIFIKKAKEVHGDKYDYKLVNYIGSNLKVKIVCKKHGVFEQIPSHHILNGYGCKKCAIENDRFTKEEFIKKSKEIHGDSYDYSQVEYINSQIKVKIYCKEHKIFFEQIPNNHLRGQGCYLCGYKKIRLSFLKRIKENKNNGYQIKPNFNKSACQLFDDISIKENIHIRHAMNGGEYHIKELGYWLDGYDKENNTVYEFDEKYHFDKNGNLSEYDLIRQQEIEYVLKCKFIRINYKEYGNVQ